MQGSNSSMGFRKHRQTGGFHGQHSGKRGPLSERQKFQIRMEAARAERKPRRLGTMFASVIEAIRNFR